MLTCVLAHARFSRDRRELLLGTPGRPGVLASWDGRVDMVVCDSARSAWHTVRAAWEEALELSGGQGHLMVAQDDFALARGGAALIEGLCERFPDRVFSFRWCDEVEPWAAPWVAETDQCYLQVAHAWSGGCLAVPAPLIEDFLAWSVAYERVLREVEWHKRDYVEDVLRHKDDLRLDLFLISRGVTVWRTRWSLLRHLGDISEVRMGVRPPSVEVNVVDDVDGLPPLSDPRWVGEDAPACLAIPEGYRNAVETLFGRHAGRLGLDHARFVYERSC